jgi:phosphatidylinositol alpha-1,6-mannosyltransferase
MRILVLTPTFLPVIGGAEIVLWQVFRRLSKRHEVLLVTPSLSASLIKDFAKNEEDYPIPFPVRRFNDRITLIRIPGHRKLKGLIPPFSLSAIFAVRAALREFKADIVNVHYTIPTGLAAVYADTVRGIPTVLTLNGRDVPGPIVPPFWKYWHRLIAARCSEITYVSEYCRRAVFGNKKIGIVTWNGVDMATVKIGTAEHLRRRLNIPDKSRVVFALQRLADEKRTDIIISAMPGILARCPDVFMVMGGTGPEEASLKNLARQLGVADRVVFTGFIDEGDVGDYFNLCDVFMFHTVYETFGIVLAQAMAYGKPVVSIWNTAVPDVVLDGQTGILTKPYDPAAMADAAVRLLENPALREKLGACGRKRALELFDWDKIADKYETVFLETLARRRGSTGA